MRLTLIRLAQLGAWDRGDIRHPGRDPAAGAALLERLRGAGYAAAITATPPHPKSGRQDAPEYVVTRLCHTPLRDVG